MNQDKRPSFEFNLPLAAECVKSFSASTQIGCFILDPLGALLYQGETSTSNCKFCRMLQTMLDEDFSCLKVHSDACFQAQRFGGKYIYMCPSGMTYFVSLITAGGITAAGVVGGPVLMVDKEEFIQHDIIEKNNLSPDVREFYLKSLKDIPVYSPDRVSHFANVLFMLSCFIAGYDNYQLLEQQKEDVLQSKINDYIQTAKKSEDITEQYPLEREKELLSAIAHGEREKAQRLLNEILGHILFGYGNHFAEIKTRVTELIVLLSRAAIDGGADPSQIFGLNFRYLNEIHQFTTMDDLSYYLSKIMKKYTESVFHLDNVKHVSAIYTALNYINSNYMKKINLEEVACLVFFSPSYFSKVFKDEMRCNFNTYLNQLRVEKSKKLLLSGSEKLVDIAALVGFEDQSYFNKVFKKTIGMTPGKFRELRGQLPAEKGSI